MTAISAFPSPRIARGLHTARAALALLDRLGLSGVPLAVDLSLQVEQRGTPAGDLWDACAAVCELLASHAYAMRLRPGAVAAAAASDAQAGAEALVAWLVEGDDDDEGFEPVEALADAEGVVILPAPPNPSILV